MDALPIGAGHADQADWSEALAHELLAGANAGLPLYLYIEGDRLEEVARRLGVEESPAAALATAIREHLDWTSSQGPFARWKIETLRWEREGMRGHPPYLSLLVLLTIAAEQMVSDAHYAAHNYRDRLSGLLKLPPEKARRLKHSFADTVQFWQSFNDWLDDWDGERGWPTARVYDRRVFVGYPLSQALVRQQDRRALHAAFEHYGLPPRRRVGVAEMTQYLDDWVDRGAPSSIQRLWADKTAKMRIARIACDELLHWNGDRDTGPNSANASASSGRLEWMAELSLAPAPKIELYLLTKQDSETVVGRYRIGSNRTDAAGLAALQGCGDELRLERLPGLNWATLEPWASIGVTSLFSASIELISVDEPRRSLARSPEPLLVLAQDDGGGSFSEARRAQLFEPCLVLTHESAGAAVERHLDQHARAGWRRFDSGALRNLPRGWLAYVDVMMIHAADEVAADKLASLCAAPATVVGLSGGLRLGQNTWHTACPPEIFAALDNDGPFLLVLIARNGTGGHLHCSEHIGRALLRADELHLDDGDYEAQLLRVTGDAEPTIAEVCGFRLRTADHPRPAGVRERLCRRHELGLGFGLISASESSQEPSLWGCKLSGDPCRRELPPAPPLGIVARGRDVSQPFKRVTHVDEARFMQSCAVRGYHYWLCEPGQIGDTYRTLKRQTCQTCHREEWTRNRGIARHHGHQPSHRSSMSTLLSGVPAYRRLHATPTEAFDRLLDALSFVGVGSVERLRNLSASLSDEEGFAWQAARVLSALGHIDLAVDRRTGRLSGWQIAPCYLAQTTDGAWVLAGARSARLIQELESRITHHGGSVSLERPDLGPTVFRAILPCELELPDLSKIASPLGHGIAYAPNFSRKLLPALPPLSAVIPYMPELEAGTGEHQWFDLAHGEWLDQKVSAPGAYRINYRGLNYGFKETPSQTSIRVGDVHLVKHLAAAEARVSLLDHDARREALLVPLGANLPGLCERVAVMCSGAAPRYRADADLLEYSSVPLEIALSLQQHLHA